MNTSKLVTLAIFWTLMVPATANSQTMGMLDSSIKGFTEPYRSIEVAAPEMGTISNISVAEGAVVQVGEVLARLDESVLLASLEMAKQSSEAKGKLNSKIAEFKLQQERLQKLLGLQERRHASQTEIDRVKSQVEIARAQVEAVEDELRTKTYEIKRIEAQLEQRRLRSPINGIVTSVSKDQGEFVSANDPVVVQVVQLNPLLIIFSVPQSQARQIKAGDSLPIKISGRDEKAVGYVEFVSPTADAQSGTCSVKLRIDNPDYKWQSGIACELDPAAIAALDSLNENQTQVVSKTK